MRRYSVLLAFLVCIGITITAADGSGDGVGRLARTFPPGSRSPRNGRR